MATFKNSAIAAVIIALTTSAHAGNIGGGPHGGMSAGAASPGMMGMQAGPGQHGPGPTGGSAAESQGGQGGRYSVVDGYQPWSEAEMRQYQKPHWTPYMGD